jgi:hypothetical protein
VIVAIVSPRMRRAVTSTTSRSMLLMLRGPPVRRGRSPAFDTAVPRYERVLLKKLFTGLRASESFVLLNDSESPVSWSSPSYVTTPSLASKPALGTRKPVIVSVTGAPWELMRSSPSNTVRLRGGSEARE